MDTDDLIKILKISVERNGEKPLTNLWLLNIIRKVRELEECNATIPDCLEEF